MVADADARYLTVALSLIIGFMVVEVVSAVLSGSLALLADAGHMLTDAGALGVSLWAARLAARPAIGAWTYGFKRAEILSAAGNGITLLIVAALVTFESVHRLIYPSGVQGVFVLIVALVGVAVNLAAAYVLAKANRSSLNVEGSFQHIVTDLYGFVATVIAGIVIVATGFARADAHRLPGRGRPHGQGRLRAAQSVRSGATRSRTRGRGPRRCPNPSPRTGPRHRHP